MKNNNIHLYLIYVLLTLFIVGNLSFSQNKSYDNKISNYSQFGQPILPNNKFQMNQEFSLMASSNGNMSQTTGIYSNFSSFQLSEKIKFHSGIHLIQNQNNFHYFNTPKSDIGYELGLEYRLSPNSIITFQFAKHSNSPIYYR